MRYCFRKKSREQKQYSVHLKILPKCVLHPKNCFFLFQKNLSVTHVSRNLRRTGIVTIHDSRGEVFFYTAHDKIFRFDCDNRTRCEADFNVKVDDLLDNNPRMLGDFLIRLLTYFEEPPKIDSESLTNYINTL